jgi:hypothetical protein
MVEGGRQAPSVGSTDGDYCVFDALAGDKAAGGHLRDLGLRRPPLELTVSGQEE